MNKILISKKYYFPSNNIENTSLITQPPNSNKPLWINEVQTSYKDLFPLIKQNELEQFKSLIHQETSNEIEIDTENYKYFNTIKKIMFSFGDVYNNNTKTIIYLHNFIINFIKNFSIIISECDFKKIINKFFNYEYEKLHCYKKLKFKNNFILNELNNNNQNKEDEKINNFFEGEEINNEKIFDFEDDSISNNEKNKKNLIKDLNYEENILFQNERTEQMDTKTYYEFFNCRQQNFLTKGKKFFISFLQEILGKNFNVEFKDFNNIELLAFILKEEIRKIIVDSIKSKHPLKKLFVLNQPLEIEDIENFCQRELNILTDFYKEYQKNINLIKEYKKKEFIKNYNKNVKLKKDFDCNNSNKIILIIKKYIYIKDNEESEFIKNVKKISERQVMTSILLLKDKLIKIKSEKNKLRKNLRNNMYVNECITKKEINKIDLIKEFGIDNYYEYFLIKDYLFDINIEKIKLIELNNKYTLLNKVNKKKLSLKFNEWLNMEDFEKNKIKEEFKEIYKKLNN